MHPHQQQLQHRRGLRSSSSAAMTNERDDDLTLFQEVRKREREQKASIIPEAEGYQKPKTSHGIINPSLQRLPSSAMHVKSFAADDLLSLDWDKNDYDWLMTPPTTPFLLTVDRDEDRQGQALTHSASVRASDKLGYPKSEPSSRAEPSCRSIRANLGFQQQLRPLNSQKPSVGLSALSTSGLDSTVRPSTCAWTQTVRLSPPAVTHLSKSSISPVASQVAMANGTTCSVPRLLVSSSRPPGFSRPPTPVRRSPSPSHSGNFPTMLVRCSSVNRASSMLSKSATLSRATSPSSKAWMTKVLHGSSQESPSNLRTSMPERSVFNVRGPSSRVTQADSRDTGCRGRRHSSSPEVVRGRKSIALINGAKGSVITGRGDPETLLHNGTKSKVGDKPALSTRKPSLSPHEEQGSAVDSNVPSVSKYTPFRDVKSLFNSVRGSSGNGQNLSKKSLDVAMKQMDICKNKSSKLRAFISGMSKASSNGLRSSCNGTIATRSNALDSPMATSSSTSSDHNVSIVIDPDGDETASEKGSRSSIASQQDICTLSRDRRIDRWLRSPDHREDDDADIMQIFQQEGLDSLSGPESPILVDLDGMIECTEFCLDPM